MAHGVGQVFTATVASGASVSGEVNLGRTFARVYVDPLSMSTSIHFGAAPVVLGAAGTYRTIKYPVISGLSAPQTVTVGTAVSGSLVEVPLAGLQFIKVYAAGGEADGASCTLICSDL